MSEAQTETQQTQVTTQQQAAGVEQNQSGQEDAQQASDAGSQTDAGNADTGSQKAERPEWLAEEFWDGDAGAIKSDEWSGHLNKMKEFMAGEQSRRAAVPEAPDGYKPPEKVDLGEGVEFSVDGDDPVLDIWRKIAHSAGQDQQGFEAGIKIYAEAQKEQMAAREALIAEQDKALGAKADERKTAVFDWLSAKYGPESADMMRPVMVIAEQFELFERIMRDGSSGSVPGFNGSGRESGGSNIDMAAYEVASFTEKQRMVREANGAN